MIIVLICICISLMTRDVEHLFMCLFTIHIYSLVKIFFMSLAHFLIGMFIFSSMLSFEEFFLYSRYKFFVTYVVYKYLVPICSLYFYTLNRVFCRAYILNIDKVPFINFYGSCFQCHANNSSPSPKVLRIFSYIIFFKSFIAKFFI